MADHGEWKPDRISVRRVNTTGDNGIFGSVRVLVAKWLSRRDEDLIWNTAEVEMK